MKSKERNMMKAKRLIVLVGFWLVIGVLVTFYDYFLLMSSYSIGGSGEYGFMESLLFNLLAALIGSITGGCFLIFYVNDKWRDKSYSHNITAVVISFITIFSFITLLMSFLSGLYREGNILNIGAFFRVFLEQLLDPMHLKNLIVWSLVVGLTQFALMLNDKFGQGVLLHFILGKYHQPRTEERVFMFADLKSSTTIAERLGNKHYHNLLKDFFADITNAILENKGQIYQYVGDEVVISWPKKEGIKDAQCIRCYLDMQESILTEKEKYLDAYGLIPEFKAGLHYGEVMAGEVGVIKRDLTFSGDVLNTTSRIQEECKKHDVGLLASDTLLGLLGTQTAYNWKHIGDINLRGKSQLVGLSTFVS